MRVSPSPVPATTGQPSRVRILDVSSAVTAGAASFPQPAGKSQNGSAAVTTVSLPLGRSAEENTPVPGVDHKVPDIAEADWASQDASQLGV